MRQGLETLQLALSDTQVAQLLRYLALLHKWNQAYNLTAVREPMQMIERHLLDSLSVVPYVQGTRIADVGTGPGLPGIPLAIVYPDKALVLMDSNGKKTRFLQQVKLELGLQNIEIYHGRVERYEAPGGFDAVISRAFASLADMLTWVGDLCHEDGVFMAMKGLYPEAELAQLPSGFALRESHRLQVPGCDGERHLLLLQRS
nr:16S rRNA (guanine(527)-N(7))-methyltransferase RsmG [Motiliproteus sp. SC1-56]